MNLSPLRCFVGTALILLVACGGGSSSSTPSKPTPVVAAPSITSFAPTAISDGTVVTLTGAHFTGTTKVQFNLTDAASLTVSSDTQILATAPAGLTAGTITVITPGGTGTSAAYTVAYPAPTITSVSPTQAQVGAPVVITGTNLGLATGLSLNGQTITAFTKTATQISFNLPATATSGNLVVTTPGGTASRVFTIILPTTTFDLQIKNVELTQSTQTLDNSVSIVAGKAGLIRVFVTATPGINTATPAVRITLLNNNTPVNGYPKVVAAPAASVPTTVNEGSLTASWNLTVPATDLTTPNGTGYSVLAEVDPTGVVAEADKTNNSFTAILTGTTVPTFKTTIFPVVLSVGTGNITEANKAQWVARLVKMYPIASVDVAVGAAFTPSITELTASGTSSGWDTLLSDLAAKHLADAAKDRYYYGAVKVSYSSGTAGLGYAPSTAGGLLAFQSRTAVGWDKASGYADGGLFPEVFAHETGHNMGRNHSPCAPSGQSLPSHLDPNYPYAGASIGQWGYDSVLNVLHDPNTDKDIMAYCTPNWVSDYTYKGILDYRTATGSYLTITTEGASLTGQPLVAQECLIVRGIVHEDGSVEMLPSFRTQALPSERPSSGNYTLECQDAQGRITFTTPLELMELGCSPAEHVRHFVMALPLEASVMNSLAGLKVLQAGQVKASLRSASGMARMVTTASDARRMSEGKLQVSWDASVHGAAMVRDADTGEVIAILSGGQQTISATAKHIDLVLSDGVTGATHRLEPTN